MGWTYTTRRPGQTVKEFFQRQFDYEKPDGRSGKILACHATWTTAYMAYEVKTPTNESGPATTQVIGIVCLIRNVPNALDGYNFGYKDMTEDMGPYENNCPESILKLLTPTQDEYAKAWRERCWNNINKQKNAPKVHKGEWIELAQPVTFRGGMTHSRLKWLSGSTFADEFGRLYRLPRWKQRYEYTALGVQDLRAVPA